MIVIPVGILLAGILNMSPEAWAQIDHQKNNPRMETAIPAAAQGGPRRWQVVRPDGLTMHKQPDLDAPIIETLPDGAMLANLGCTLTGQAVWCQIQPFQSRGQGYVMAAFLSPMRDSDGTILTGVDNSRSRARQGDFDATGRIPCAQIRNQMMEPCLFGVARSDGGDATVAVTFANGFKRMLFFTNAAFISADTTMSGTGFDTDWRMEDNRHFIRVEDQRYEVPTSIITGNE